MPGGSAVAPTGAPPRVAAVRKGDVWVHDDDVDLKGSLDVTHSVVLDDNVDNGGDGADHLLTRAISADDTKTLLQLLEGRAHVDHPLSNLALSGVAQSRSSGITPLQLACHKSAW